MSDMPWVRFFPSDWLAGTRGMSAAETGIYITLIASMYERGEPVPEDHARLARLCGASRSAFKATIENLISEGKIVRKDGGLWNERVGKESESRAEKSEVGRKSAEARWREKSNKNNSDDDANALQTQSVRNASQKPDTRSQNIKPLAQQSEPRERAALPDDWQDQCLKANGISTGFRDERHIGLLNPAPLIGLLEAGFDWRRDIIAGIASKPNLKARTWGYFEGQIRDFAADRDKTASLPKPEPPAIDWAARLEVFHRDGVWGSWGPRPGEKGCRVPSELLGSPESDEAAA